MKKIVLFIIIIVCLLLSVCVYAAGTSEQGNAYCGNGGASETVNANMYCWAIECCGGSGSEVWG